MYQCPNCAGNLKFDIARQRLFCEYCKTTVDPYEISEEKDVEEGSDEYEVTIFTCPQCGGEIISEDTTAATFCSFCGAATILESRVSKERRPAHIIPFTRTKEDCKKAYDRMMRRAIFAPKEYKNPDNLEKFRGIYMPYWVYSFEKKDAIRVPGSKSYRRGDYIYTSYYNLDCDIEVSYKGLSYDASASFADNLSQAIAPFDLQQGKEFTPAFLSGFYADTSDVNANVYKYDAENMVVADGSRRLSHVPGFGKYKVTNYSLKNAVRPKKTSTQLAMLPVWFLSYRSGDRVSYAVVNGQTGKVAAEIPMDLKKYAIGSALLTIPLFFLLNLFFTFKPTTVLLLAILLAGVSLVISNKQIARLKQKEMMTGDKGLESVQARKNRRNLAEEMAEGKQRAKSTGSSSTLNFLAKGLGRTILLIIGLQVSIPILSMLFLRIHGGITGVVGLMITVFLFVFVVNRIAYRKNLTGQEEDDREEVRVPLKEKLPTLWKPIAGIAAAVLILLLNPVQDSFYYIGVILCLIMVIWAFADIVKQHNELTTRKLPQFNRRGGDENV